MKEKRTSLLKIFIFLFAVTITCNGFSQVQTSAYPYQNPEWIYLQKWTDYFQTPPLTFYSFLTCKSYGDTIKYGKQYMKVGSDPLNGSNAYNYYRQSNDSVFENIFAYYDSTDYINADYNAIIGDQFNSVNDTVLQTWNTLLMDGESKRSFQNKMYYGGDIDTVIEDIGSIHTPWYAMGYTTLSPIWTKLVCFKNGNTVLYYKPVNFTFNSINYVNPCSGLVTSAANQINNNLPEQITIFPSPFSNQATIQTDRIFKNVTLTLYNSCGQKVKQIKKISGQTITLHRDNLAGGLYFYRLIQDNRIISAGKFVISDN